MEEYTANHAETVDQILQWRGRRFQAFFERFAKRRLVESVERRKEQMIAALWANSGFEGEEGSRERTSAIEGIEENFKEAVKVIRRGVQEEPEIDKSNPFFQAATRGVKKLERDMDSDVTMKEIVDAEVDQG